MRDYLEFYNTLDVSPMLKAVEAYIKYFLGMNLDVFKEDVSIPGIARKMLFRQGLNLAQVFYYCIKRIKICRIKSSLVWQEVLL